MNINDTTFSQAVTKLRNSDSIMRKIIDAVGPCTLRIDTSPFRMLIRAVTGQQLSVAAAHTIWTRFIEINGTKRVSPSSLSRITDHELRQVGISGAKVRSIRGIQNAFAHGDLSIPQLRALSDANIKKALCDLRGIGPWTADMFLMFGLGRLNVFPIGDLGLRNAIGEFYGCGERPDRTTMHEIGDRWSPFRTIATWYCWRGLDALRTGHIHHD